MMEGDNFARATYLLVILVVLGGWALVEYRGRLGFALRSALAWGLIFVGGLAALGLWNDIRPRFAPVQQTEGASLVTERARDGHFYLTLTIDGQPVEFVVDTGASGVVIGQDDAARLGIETEGLAFLGEAQTANGAVRTARVWLRDVRLGDWSDADLPAYVTQGEMRGSLLGMDYLHLYRMEIDGNQMRLTRRN
ncbi:retropepsin-like aspartic protease family protein [Gemmobacter caeruleus]|uniref:retropepsin-like aspartic protease family protein n=1 Tax=Gemmobacter caeruleus TaxID=2595004 RepID=UPI001EF064E3|nr:TIGR02281 family clan AA aspartic protease [Gemmobacter caeruleus]